MGENMIGAVLGLVWGLVFVAVVKWAAERWG